MSSAASYDFCFINTARDAALMIVASEAKKIEQLTKRLKPQERNAIHSGSCFVFSETKSGMKRWTDGMKWSKSRVEGNFLVYSQMQPESKRKKISDDHLLCKKTFAISIRESVWHVVPNFLT